MQFESLKSLTLFNCEGKTIDFDDGVLPLLVVVGSKLENLILSKFEQVDIVRKCIRLSSPPNAQYMI